MSFMSELPTLGHLVLDTNDDGALLAGISASMIPGHEDQTAGELLTLLMEHQDVAVRLGWDLLSMFFPHLNEANVAVQKLTAHITQVCSPREMVVALLEQLEVMACNISSFLLLLSLLKPVLLQVCLVIVTSALNSTAVYMCKYSCEITDGPQQYNEDSLERNSSSQDVTTSSFSMHCIQFVQPFVVQLDTLYSDSRGVAAELYNSMQHSCLAMLLQVMQFCGTSQIDAAMKLVVQCHYGFLAMIEWTPSLACGDRQNEDKKASFSSVGMALVVHFLLMEGQGNYVPQVISHGHLLVSSLTHVKCLLKRQEKALQLNGIRLLECVLQKVGKNQLPVELMMEFDNVLYVPMVLTDVMVTCPYNSVRRHAVVLLSQFIASFSSHGRYKLYKDLLHRVEHAGVRSLLVHLVKEEVDATLKSRGECKLFIGNKLDALASHFMTVCENTNIVEEYDRVMASLNFLRFLLLRDHRDHNQTGVWDKVKEYQGCFLVPLRKTLHSATTYCRACIDDDNTCSDASLQLSEMEVKIAGVTTLPPPSLPEYKEAMMILLQKLDMMQSVLVRVEELAVV